jgi:hypothetical protein
MGWELRPFVLQFGVSFFNWRRNVIGRHHLFLGFYKAVVVRNPGIVAAIKEMMKCGQPYLGAFLLKDENTDSDVKISALSTKLKLASLPRQLACLLFWKRRR